MLSPSCINIESCGLSLPLFSGLGRASQEPGLLAEALLVCELTLDLGRVSPFLLKLTSARCMPRRVQFHLLHIQGECLGVGLVWAGTCLVLADPHLVLAEESLVAEDGPMVEKDLVGARVTGGLGSNPHLMPTWAS